MFLYEMEIKLQARELAKLAYNDEIKRYQDAKQFVENIDLFGTFEPNKSQTTETEVTKKHTEIKQIPQKMKKIKSKENISMENIKKKKFCSSIFIIFLSFL